MSKQDDLYKERQLLTKYISVLEVLNDRGIGDSNYLIASYLGEGQLSFAIYKEDLPDNFFENKIKVYKERLNFINDKLEKAYDVFEDAYPDFDAECRISSEVRKLNK